MQYDLIIVGGGLVGSSLAIALQETALRIAVIDARMPSQDDPRLFALNQSSCHFLENINIWPAISHHASPIHQVHVSYRGHFGAVRLNREDVQSKALGYVIPARLIEQALNEKLSTQSNVTVYRPAKLRQLFQQEGFAFLKIEADHNLLELSAPIVIGADGTDSTVRAEANIPVKTIDYHQSAIVTRTTLKRSHKQIAYERFIEDGAIAMLPLTDNECATIWSASNEKIAALMMLSDQDFLQNLQQEFGYRLGTLEKIQQRFLFPLKMVKAERMIEQSVFLLGNSAHTLHPIAAQGFNLALYEVAVFAEVTRKMESAQHFSADHLTFIKDQIEKQKNVSIGMSHRLSTFFSKNNMLTSLLLPLGMIGLDVIPPLKKKFMREMLGKRVETPHLLLSD